MLNDLNILIGIEIELKIRVFHTSAIYSQNLLPNYFIPLQLYINSKQGVSMFDPTREHDMNPTRVFSG